LNLKQHNPTRNQENPLDQMVCRKNYWTPLRSDIYCSLSVIIYYWIEWPRLSGMKVFLSTSTKAKVARICARIIDTYVCYLMHTNCLLSFCLSVSEKLLKKEYVPAKRDSELQEAVLITFLSLDPSLTMPLKLEFP
jgi:hypothetical protein